MNDVRKSWLSFLGATGLTIVTGGVIYYYVSPLYGISFVIYALCGIPLFVAVYFIGTFFLTEFIHWLGGKLIQLSEYYPERMYPKVKYTLRVSDETNVYLRIQSFPKNREFELFLSVSKIYDPKDKDLSEKIERLLTPQIVGGVLFSKKIGGNDTREKLVASKEDDRIKFLFWFGGSVTVPTGRYIYVIKEGWRRGEGRFIGDRKYELTIELTEKGDFKI